MKKIHSGILLAMSMASAQAAEPSPAPAWYDHLKLSGDLRYRAEITDAQANDASQFRNRVRVRFGLTADLGDGLSAGLRLATNRDEPTSTFQTLGDGFTGKPLRLDLGYIAWKPEDIGLEIYGGKIEQPTINVSDLIWDTDVNPEGLGFRYSLKGGKAEFLLSGGALWVTEDPADDNTMLYAGQAAVRIKPREDAYVLVGAGVYAYNQLSGHDVLFNNRAFGNSAEDLNADTAGQEGVTPHWVFAHDYTEVEGFAEAGVDVGIPITVYGQYVVNTEVDEEDTAWLAGAAVGRARAVNSIELGYNYRSLEKDALVGTFTDADCGGGGTNHRGHKIYIRYQATKALQLALNYFLFSQDPDGKDLRWQRVQLDVAVKF